MRRWTPKHESRSQTKFCRFPFPVLWPLLGSQTCERVWAAQETTPTQPSPPPIFDCSQLQVAGHEPDQPNIVDYLSHILPDRSSCTSNLQSAKKNNNNNNKKKSGAGEGLGMRLSPCPANPVQLRGQGQATSQTHANFGLG